MPPHAIQSERKWITEPGSLSWYPTVNTKNVHLIFIFYLLFFYFATNCQQITRITTCQHSTSERFTKLLVLLPPRSEGLFTTFGKGSMICLSFIPCNPAFFFRPRRLRSNTMVSGLENVLSFDRKMLPIKLTEY